MALTHCQCARLLQLLRHAHRCVRARTTTRRYLLNNSCPFCYPGTYCPSQRDSFLCKPGTYSDRPGLVSCISCDNSPNVGFANRTGAVACDDCPANSHRTISTSVFGGSRLEDCICRAGFYEPDGLQGRPCLACPPGAICFGGTTPPRPRPG